MKKKLCLLFVSLFMLLSFPATVSANEEMPRETDNFSIIGDNTLYNDEDDSYYAFISEEDMQEFLAVLDDSQDSTTYACIPGDPGYPHCNGDAVIKVNNKVLSTTTTGYRLSKNYLMGDGGWCFGPGNYSISIGESFSVSFGVNYKAYTANISFGVTATSTYDYHVTKLEKGNVKYQSKFKVSEIQPIYTHESGKVTYGKKYLTAKRIIKGAGFIQVTLPNDNLTK